MTRMTPSEAFVETLVAQGVTEIFGIVGSAYMDALDIFEPAGIRFISVALAFIPAIVLSLNLYHRIVFARFDGRTYCGTCGHTLKNLARPQCPACGESI